MTTSNNGGGLHSLDALIADGLALQGNAVELERLIHEGMRDVLGAEQGAGLLQPIPEGAVVHQPVGPTTQHLNTSAGLAAMAAAAAFERDVASQVHDSRDPQRGGQGHPEPPSAPMSEDEVEQEESGDDNEAQEDDVNETGSSGKPARGVKRKKGARRNPQGMQGRFSGRLETKEDEKRLADECRLLGQYLSEAGSGEKALQTLAKIVRGIASGDVRRHMEARERELQELRNRLNSFQGVPDHQLILQLQDENAKLRSDLQLRTQQLASLERELAAANARLQNVAAAATGTLPAAQPTAAQLAAAAEQTLSGTGGGGGMLQQQQQPVQQVVQAPTATAVVAVQPPTVSIGVPVGSASVGVQLQVPMIQSQQATLPLASVPLPLHSMGAASGNGQAAGLGQPALPQQQQQQQLTSVVLPSTVVQSKSVQQLDGSGLSGMQQQLTANGIVSLPQPVNQGTGGIQLVLQQPAATGLPAQAQPVAALPTQQVVSVVGQPATMTLVQQVMPAPAPATSQALSSDMGKPLATSVDNGLAAQAAPAVKQEAAMVLQDHVQHLAVQATLHGQAKNQAETQVQQLAQQANLHAQASVQAAVQAEQLKKTLAVLPESDRSAQQAVATVESLEARAQAHAEITAQAVQQAREMQEQAQAHAQEQAKAIAQATMLQAQAHTLQVTAQQASEVQPGQALPALALPNGTDAQAPLAGMSAQAAAVAQAQSTLSGNGPTPQSLSLGGPSDMQMCQELGLLPTSPLSAGNANGNGHNGAAALAAAAALPPLLQAQPAVVQPSSLLPAQPAAAAVAAQAPMPVAQQVATGGSGLQVLGGQQQVVGGTLVAGTAVVNVQHGGIPTSQVQLQMLHHSGEQASLGSQLLQAQAQLQPQSMTVIQAQLGLNGGSADASAMLQQQQSQQQQQQQSSLAGQASLAGQSSMVKQGSVAQPSMGGQPSLGGQTSLGGPVSLSAQLSGPSQEQMQDRFAALHQQQHAQMAAVQQQQHQQAQMAAAQQQHQQAQLAAQQQAQLAQEHLAAAAAAQQQQHQHQQQMAAAAQIAGQIAVLQQHQQQVTAAEVQQQQQQAQAQASQLLRAHSAGMAQAAASAMLQPGGSAATLAQPLSVSSGMAGGRNGSASEQMLDNSISGRESNSLQMQQQNLPIEATQQQQQPAQQHAMQPTGNTGFTPNVGGGLDLPPGMEALLPSVQPLSMDPASLSVAAAMAPVVAIPSDLGHLAAAQMRQETPPPPLF